MEFIVDSVDKTMHIGRQLGSLVNKGDILCLTGDLGTGKTHISKGIAEGLGIDEYIFGDGVSLIEWANYIEELIPEEYIHIKIEKLPDMGENFRKISINGYGDRYNYIKEIKEC